MKPISLLTFLFLFSTVAFASKPNVIVVLVDDMGYSDLGSFGGRSRRLT